MEETFNTISEVISANIKNLNALFVFPTDIIRSSWINWVIKNPNESGVRALNTEQFTAWDKFKISHLISADSRLTCIPPVLRKIFIHKTISENNREHFFKKIISSEPALQKNAFGFTDWMTKILPSLKLWHEQYYLRAGIRDEEDEDYETLYSRYNLFLNENGFYEPSYLDADLKKTDESIFVFYPEIIEDFPDFEKIFNSADNITAIRIPEHRKEISCLKCSNARQELRYLALELRKLHVQNTDLRKVAVNVPDIETVRPYLERELELYSVPYTIRSGIPYTRNCGGDIFIRIKDCADSDFSYDSLRALLLDGYIPWKNYPLNESLVREGSEKRCICSYEENKRIQDIWALSLEDGTEEKKLYEKIRDAVDRFTKAKSFRQVKFAWDNFKGSFICEKKFKDPQYVLTDRIIGRIITELNELVSIEEKYMTKTMYVLDSPFSFFINELQQKQYIPDDKKYGVNIFPYRLSVCADYEYQFIINATQTDLSVPFKKFGFISNTEKRKEIGSDRDAAADYIQLYAADQRTAVSKTVYFSTSEENFTGFAIMHTALKEADSDKEKNSEDLTEKYDFISAEKKSFINGDISPRLISAMQKTAFKNWTHVSAEADEKEAVSAELKEKIDHEMKHKSMEDSDPDKVKISPTQMNSFFKCPRSFLFKNVLKLREDTLDADLTKSYEAGTMIHRIIELVCTGLKQEFNGCLPLMDEGSADERILNEISSAFEKAKLEVFADSRLALKVIESQKTLICNDIVLPFFRQFCSENSFGGYHIKALEKPLEVQSGNKNYDYFGKPDCVLEDTEDSGYVIVDYKTGTVPKKSECTAQENLKETGNETEAETFFVLKNFQMACYVELLEKSGGKLVENALFYQIKKDKEKNYIFTETNVIDENGNNKRASFTDTMNELEVYADYFYSKYTQYDFRPVDFYDDRHDGMKYGIKTHTDCKKCSYKSICRTSFNIAGREIN